MQLKGQEVPPSETFRVAGPHRVAGEKTVQYVPSQDLPNFIVVDYNHDDKRLRFTMEFESERDLKSITSTTGTLRTPPDQNTTVQLPGIRILSAPDGSRVLSAEFEPIEAGTCRSISEFITGALSKVPGDLSVTAKATIELIRSMLPTLLEELDSEFNQDPQG